mgnify:CR=1 FL=1
MINTQKLVGESVEEFCRRRNRVRRDFAARLGWRDWDHMVHTAYFSFAGHVARDVIWTTLLSLPVVICITMITTRFTPAISDLMVRRAAFLLLIVTGLGLVIPSVHFLCSHPAGSEGGSSEHDGTMRVLEFGFSTH